MPRHAIRPTAPALDPDELADLALAPLTREAYARGFQHFESWCDANGLESLPASPETVRRFIASEVARQYAPATLRQRLSAVHHHHRRRGLPSPVGADLARLTARGAGRLLAVGRGARQAEAFTMEELRRALLALPDDLRGRRDRALLALGTTGAFREEELVGIAVDDLRPQAGGYRVWLDRSKGDRRGTGCWQVARDTAFMELEVVKHVEAWRDAGGVTAGALLRGLWRGGSGPRSAGLSTRGVDRVVRRAAALLELPLERYSGHSLRATWISAAFAHGIPPHDIAAHARHRSLEQTLTYRRERVGVARDR